MGKCQLFLRYLVKFIDFFFRACYNVIMKYDKTLTETLQSLIFSKYKNIKQFSDDSGIPYMTISNVLKRGVENSSFGTISRICDALNYPIYSLSFIRAEDTILRKLIELGNSYTDLEFFHDLKDGGFIRNSSEEDFFKDSDKAKRILETYKEIIFSSRLKKVAKTSSPLKSNQGDTV